MMHRAADSVANWLVKGNAIGEEEAELYSYAMYSFLITSIPLILSIVVGTFMNMLLESILFIAPFVIIRKYSGGFHLKSPTVCLIVSTGIIAVFLLCIKFVLKYEFYPVALILAILSAILLFIKSPIDSEARKLSDRETIVFGKIAKSMVVIFLAVTFILTGFHIYRIAIPISFGIILPGALQVPCCFIKHKD